MKQIAHHLIIWCLVSIIASTTTCYAEETTNDICSIFALANCTDQTSCEAAGGFWCDTTCQIYDCNGPTCNISNLDLCHDRDSCDSAGGYWYDDACNSTPMPGCAEIAPPTEHTIGMCGTECQETTPMLFEGSGIRSCFNYTSKVDIIAGFMNSEFTQIAWINPDCSVTADFAISVKQGQDFLCYIDIPEFASHENGGWIFWLVSATPAESIDWVSGIYEILYEPVPESCDHFTGHTCISCTTSCDLLFPDSFSDMLDCEQWQEYNCQ